MIHWLAALLVVSRLILPFSVESSALSHQRSAQADVQIEDQGVTYQFGQQVNFQAQVITTAAVENVIIYITPTGRATVWQNALLSADNKINHAVDVRQLSLRPFSAATYRYQVNLADGQSVNSPEFSFVYEDNRFTWQELSNSDFVVFSYGRDPAFGQEVLNIASQGMQRARAILDVTPPTPIKIYVYNSSRDLQSALLLDNQPWVAGHATPDLGLVMLSIPSGPEQKLELERQVPHELMHILQYQQAGEDFRQQPVWLLEGMASIAELYPNPEYQHVLTTSANNQELLPFNTLCAGFPREAAGTYKAYAQSESFVRFLHRTYGSSGLVTLLEQYQDGLGCEEGPSAAFGMGLGQLEYRWKSDNLGMNAAALAMHNLSPYLILMILLAVPALMALLPFAFKKPIHEASAP